ncbi:MAG: 30S ribosome-binding factor RbfA [Clostridia bacterium]|nr:30S ribosome-binding factor RbfA [Clostridia bacterium]
MPSYKIGRVNADLQRELADLIRGIKDPRVSSLISVVKVDVSGDLSVAKIYISAIEGTEETENSVKGLKSAAGYLRRELSHRLKLRKIPELVFLADDSIRHSAHIAALLNDLEK